MKIRVTARINLIEDMKIQTNIVFFFFFFLFFTLMFVFRPASNLNLHMMGGVGEVLSTNVYPGTCLRNGSQNQPPGIAWYITIAYDDPLFSEKRWYKHGSYL